MDREKEQEVKKTISDLFQMIDEDIRVDFYFKEEVIKVSLKMKSPQVFIGEKGQTLIDIERILKIIIKKMTEELIFVNLDINNYRQRKIDYLKSLAEEVADEVSTTGIEKKFPPMPAYERRIVHVALSERTDVITESINEGKDRRVVIRESPKT